MTVKTSYENGVLTVSRSYDHPQKAVFAAWIEAGQTQEWWGCANTTQVASQIDPRVGGIYEHAMTIKGVGVHPIQGTFTAFDPPNHLAYEMPGMSPSEKMHVSVTFTETDGTTLVTLTQSVVPDQFGAIVQAGWTASFDRLGRYFNGERRAA